MDPPQPSFIAAYPGAQSIGTIALANIPQILITISYFSFNSILTAMLAAAEYSSYGAVGKALRVTRPVKGSQQRSTYWLSVPYKYGIPVLIVHVVLHWLVSQSFYFVMITPYDVSGNLDEDGIYSAIAIYSPPILASMVIVALMFCSLLALSCRKFKSDIPLAGNCSAAISAACHPRSHENLDTAALGPVMWTEITEQSGRPNPRRGYFSFTSSDSRNT